ncbi:MAG: hypothetical protein Q9186_005649 [Xanthomendoza sp. 1 TL-2023]
MPKRPCAISYTPDLATIICGDKFGDVYALPLLQTNASDGGSLQPPICDAAKEETPLTRSRYIPSATSRTVHTLRNQEALKHQQNIKNQKSSRKDVDFEHQLLFGHVSLLTDLCCVSLPDITVPDSHNRTYIISADRDEHIRISRGIPQAHIIEGYCLGHTQFVSKLCVPGWNPRVLVSGGGDDYLLVWDWISSRILDKVDLREAVADVFERRRSAGSVQDQSMEAADVDSRWNKQIAVLEICALEAKTAAGEIRRQILVACEGVPAIFFFDILEDGTMQYGGSTATEGDVICIALSGDHDRIAYAMEIDADMLSQSNTTNQLTGPRKPSIGMLSFDALTGVWVDDQVMENTITGAVANLPQNLDDTTGEKVKGRGSVSSLYSLENLRKRVQDE